ncbi:gamma-glutamyl-gamma-aminobutyrate hydrolase family protein [Roseibium sp. AS2]|uniref:gamma-glutamyl-gamma-aminobutyrate hydrolase family protein n=1 Tax=Roseibium sp. AS2 TaxID=3135781 RepID=UPI00317006A0
MKPLIGVSTSVRGGWRSFLAIRFALWRVGAKARRITAATAQEADFDFDQFDGLIAGGGDDISATLYGGELTPDVRLDPERDALETRLISAAVERGIPVLGICRGAQMINVSFGGSLHTDVWEVFVKAPKLRTVLPRKKVNINRRTWLSAVLDCNPCRVNALHHQSVKDLGRGLKVSAVDDFGIIQAIEGTFETQVIGVQWHPELMPFSHSQTDLFTWFANSARNRVLIEQQCDPGALREAC